MPKKKSLFILPLLALLMIFQSGTAGTESSGRITTNTNQKFIDSTQFLYPKYFYTTCRDLPALIHLAAEGKLDSSYTSTLSKCSTYLIASMDWFLSLFRITHGIKFLECYSKNSKFGELSIADASTLFFSYLNLNEDLLDAPGAATPLLFWDAVSAQYPTPKKCKNYEKNIN